MATYDWPAGIRFTSAVITARSAVGAVISPYSFSRESQNWGGERWEMSLEFLRTTRAQAAAVEAFLLRLRGGIHQVRLGDPWGSLPQGSRLGTPVVGASATAGATSFASKGWGVSQSGVLLTNDYLEIDERLYRVLADVDADANGDATIEVWPRLRESYAEDTSIRTQNPRTLWSLAEPSVTFSRDQIGLYETSVALIEHL